MLLKCVLTRLALHARQHDRVVTGYVVDKKSAYHTLLSVDDTKTQSVVYRMLGTSCLRHRRIDVVAAGLLSVTLSVLASLVKSGRPTLNDVTV